MPKAATFFNYRQIAENPEAKKQFEQLFTRANVENPEQSKPEPLSLTAYPNPFNSAVTLSYSLQNNGEIKLEIRSLTGQIVRSFITGSNVAGVNLFVWDGTDSYGQIVSSGAYLATLRSSGESVTTKIMFMK